MKLYIAQEGNGLRGSSFKLFNRKGERFPNVVSASVHHHKNDCARVDLSFLIDGEKIRFGEPPPMQTIKVEFQDGSRRLFSQEDVVELIKAINQAVADGALLKVSY